MKQRLEKWRRAGFHFRLELMLRVVNALVTGEALFDALDEVDIETFKSGLKTAERRMDSVLNLISSRLGLDHDRVLGSRYSFPLLVRYLDQRGGKLTDHRERDRLLYWYIHCLLWGRYAGSTETVLNQDLERIEDSGGALDRLIEGLRRERGDLSLQPADFEGWSRGARFYPLLYLMTRVLHARDWGSGIELRNDLLGKMAALHLHHIFPKATLYKHGYSKAEVNALANFTFLTAETNLEISDEPPHDYLPRYIRKHPGAVESHWMPLDDPELWRPENYLDFLRERRRLLAASANRFLASLATGQDAEAAPVVTALEPEHAAIPGGILGSEEEESLLDLNIWVVDQGLPEGEFPYELVGPKTGEVKAVFDLAWPAGLQEGLSQPVALLIDEGPQLHELANKAGFRYFTDIDDFKNYVERDVLALEET